MRKKIISLFLTISVFLNSSGFVFANTMPVPTVPISYELLMGLMGIGLTFGLALPQTDEEYYDYTSSLKNHLRLVDEDYLKELDEHFKNNRNNDKKFQVPYIPVLEKLFQNVGKDVSKPGVKVYSHSLGSWPYARTTSELNSDNCIKIEPNVYTGFFYINSLGKQVHINLKRYYKEDVKQWWLYRKIETSDGKVYEKDSRMTYNYDIGLTVHDDGNIIMPLIFYYTSDGKYFGSPSFTGSPVTAENYAIRYKTGNPEGVIRSKTSIEYNPTLPSVDSDNQTITLPSIPNIPIPNPESLPSTPPFDVSEPLEIPNPNPNPNPNPDGDIDGDTDGEGGGNGNSGLPSFPNMGDELDFSPLYMTNIKDKFPFSLPWDLKNLISMFDVTPTAPKFDVPFLGQNIVLDFSYFEEWAVIIRFFISVSFTATLIFISTKMKG